VAGGRHGQPLSGRGRPWPVVACRGQLWPELAGRGQPLLSVFTRNQAPPLGTGSACTAGSAAVAPSKPAGAAYARRPRTRRCRVPTRRIHHHTGAPPAARPIDPAVAGPDLRPPATVAAGTGHAGRISGAGTAALFTPPPIQGSKGRAAAVLSRLKGFRRPPRAAATVPARPPTRGRRERGGRRLHPRCCYRKIIGVSLSTVMPLTT
jgi:hypothetical protein